MDNLELLFSKNNIYPATRTEVRNGNFVFRQRDNVVNASSIRTMIRFVNTLLTKYPNAKLPIVFDMGRASFFDKLTYIIFECLCDYLIEDCGYKVRVTFSPQTKIHTAGIKSSPLWLLTTGQEEHIRKFKKSFL